MGKSKKKKQKNNTKVKSDKFLRKQNIILMSIGLLLIAASILVSKLGSRQRNEFRKQLDSLPELTSTEQILSAVNSDESRHYLVTGYTFPSYKAVTDPYDWLGGKYLYISVSLRDKEKSQSDRRFDKTAFGHFFFDKDTELLGIDENSFSPVGLKQKKRYSNSTEYYMYYYIEPGAKFSFVALLGNGKASLSGFGDTRCIVQGDKDKLVESSGSVNSLISLLLAIGAGLCAIGVIGDYFEIKSRKKKALQKELKKKQEEEDWKKAQEYQEEQMELIRQHRENSQKDN
ncbi:MAG: hypothetical protein J5817_02530 [Treponema sp.]|nr:hypothetical protein [Treponema sp.]